MTSFKWAAVSLALTGLLANPGFARDMGTPLPGRNEMSPGVQDSGMFSTTQLAEMQARIALANTIAGSVAADAQAKGLADSWRVNLLSSLLNTPSATLRTVAATAGTLDQAHAQALAAAAVPPASPMASTASSPKSLGSSIGSLVYTPLTPCRFADTRVVGGPLTGTPRTFSTELNTFGGDSNCRLPSGTTLRALAFAANITIVDPEGGPGFLSVRPAGSMQLTSFLNWSQTGPAVAIANAGIVTTNLANVFDPQFEMFVAGGSPSITGQAIVDFFGYFSTARSPLAVLDCQDVNVNSHVIKAGQVDSVAVTCVPAGPEWTLTGGGCDTDSSKAFLLSSRISDGDTNSWTCRYANTGGDALIAAHAKCCIVLPH